MDQDEQRLAQKIEALIGNSPLREPDERRTIFRRARWKFRVSHHVHPTENWFIVATGTVEERKPGERTVTVSFEDVDAPTVDHDDVLAQKAHAKLI